MEKICIYYMSVPKKIRRVQAMIFPMILYGSESCSLKKLDRKKTLILLNLGVGVENNMDSQEKKQVDH